MKKISLSIFVFLFFQLLCLNAQSYENHFAQRGTKLLNPQLLNVSFQSISVKDAECDCSESQDLSQLGLSIAGGYAIIDNLFITGQFTAQSLGIGSDIDASLTLVSLGAGARYYFGKIFVGAALLANHARIGMGGDIDEFDDDDDFDFDFGIDMDDISTTLFSYRAEVGYAYFLTPSVAIEPSISYGGQLAGGELQSGGESMMKIGMNQLGINLGVSVFF